MEQELYSLLDSLHQKYGYDFTEYSEAHIQRRINNRLTLSSFKSIGELQNKVLTDSAFASILLQDLSITVTEMFRDPEFYRILREVVVPILKTYPFIKVWHAGCSTGEEAYSMAIVLREEGLYERTTIYATDFNQYAINTARDGIFSIKSIKEYTSNYQKAGGKESFSNYYTCNYNSAILDQSLKKNIVWANHNLVTDGVFSEVHMVFCRNVLIYFKTDLQKRVHQLFHDSLVSGGILCLGSKESLKFSGFQDKYSELSMQYRIFKRKYKA